MVAFHGYWRERGGALETTAFNELEAWTVLARLPEAHDIPARPALQLDQAEILLDDTPRKIANLFR